MQITGRVGPGQGLDGTLDTVRLGRTLERIVTKGHGVYHDAAARGAIYSMYLNATSSTIAAGQINAAAALASTQFCLWNPIGSPVGLSLLRFGMGLISGTPAAGAVCHSLAWGNSITVASSGTVYSHKYGVAASQSGHLASAAGTALVGSKALNTVRCASFATTATAGASVSYVRCIEEMDGDILLMPGMLWVPTHRSAGTLCLHNYSVTWEELPL